MEKEKNSQLKRKDYKVAKKIRCTTTNIGHTTTYRDLVIPFSPCTSCGSCRRVCK